MQENLTSYRQTLSRSPSSKLRLNTKTPDPIKQILTERSNANRERDRDLGKYKVLFEGIGELSISKAFRIQEMNGQIMEQKHIILGRNLQDVPFFVELNSCNKECRNDSLTPSLQLAENGGYNSVAENPLYSSTVNKMCDMIEFSKIYEFYPEIGIMMKTAEGLIYKVFVRNNNFFASVYQENVQHRLLIEEEKYYLLIFDKHLDQVILSDEDGIANISSLETDKNIVYKIGNNSYSISKEIVNVISLNISKYTAIFNAYDKWGKIKELKTKMENLLKDLEKHSEVLNSSKLEDINEKLIDISEKASIAHQIVNCVERYIR